MNTKYIAGIAASFLMTGISSAVVINGVTFTDGAGVGGLDGNTGGGNTDPSSFVSSVVLNSGSSSTINGVFNQNSYIETAVSIFVGDTIEFDLSYSTTATQGTDNFTGARYFGLFDTGGTELIGSGTNQSQDMEIQGDWTNTNLDGNAVFHITLEITATGVDWTIAGTSDGTTPVTSDRTGTQALTIADIEVIRFGANDTRTALTVENFVITSVPEPSSTALLGLGGLAFILLRRK